jgi:copper chaperone CopZ
VHCAGCIQKVRRALESVPGILTAAPSVERGEVAITMERHVPTEQLNGALEQAGPYTITGEVRAQKQEIVIPPPITAEKPTSYFPLILVLGYISLGVGIGQILRGGFNFMTAMTDFMAGFFILFSFFKLLDLRGFVDSYAGYDIPTKYFRAYGYLYPFIELGFGVAYFIKPESTALHISTLIIMSVSIIGVLKSLLNKRAIRCACLGTVFNLPMGTVTVIEDGLMIAMSLLMILL